MVSFFIRYEEARTSKLTTSPSSSSELMSVTADIALANPSASTACDYWVIVIAGMLIALLSE